LHRPSILAASLTTPKLCFNLRREDLSAQRKVLSEFFKNSLLAVIARFKAFKTRGPSMSSVGKRPQRASASKVKSSVLSELSGLENVDFNDFIDDELDSEDVSEQRASASLPDYVPIESEEERVAREKDEIAALDAVWGFEADATVMMEDVPQDIVLKTLKLGCVYISVLVCVYVYLLYVFVRICICIS
jgi:hypothetical protein